MTQQKKPSPRDPSGAYLRMQDKWALADALLGGTDALRAAAETFLPRHDQESKKAYENRLARATLVNQFEDTLDSLSGRPFSEDLTLGEDVPEQLAALLEDVDLQGTALQPFARAWFRTGWAKGLAHVLVDHPQGQEVTDEAGNVRPRTLADDRAENLRPYMVLLRPENVLAAYSEVVNGRERLCHVRILETTVERVDEWEEACVERVKVLEQHGSGPVMCTMYKYNEQNKEWVPDGGSTPLGIDYIPLHTFYAGKRLGLHECKPPLHDLAHLNVAHWQSASDQRNVLTVARFPILAASGFTPETTTGPDGQVQADVKIGPNQYLTTEDPQGKWYYVEHTGAAIEAGRNDLKDLEERMASYGAEFLRQGSGDETATGRALDTAEATSYLGATVQEFQDVLDRALQSMADWMKIEAGGSVTLKGEFTLSETDATELASLEKARDRKDISRLAYIEELKRRKILRDDYDPVEDRELIDEEKEEAAQAMMEQNEGMGGPGLPAPKKPPPADPGE